MKSALFISDLHIQNMADPKATGLLNFLKNIRANETSHIFFMGDIFDFWIGNHGYFIKEYQPIIEELRRLKKELVELCYFEGNHDLHLRGFWQDQLGFKVYSEAVYLEVNGKTLRLEHGDQMDPDDKGYLFLRWFLRTPPLKFLAHQLPGAVVAEIGKRSSSKSRAYTSEVKKITHDQARAKIHLHAEKAFAEKAFDLIISGHVHVRDHYKLTSGAESWNLGTWLDEPGYLELKNGAATWKELESRDA